jgi:PAS domain S-box-containing protein
VKKNLQILIVEDNSNDADLMVEQLRRSGFDPQWKRVELEEDFLAEIKKNPDIILSDYSMPQFSGVRAAELLQESGLNIPFILVSGTMGEDVAVDAMQRGATDYLLKDRIAHLGAAVEHALEQKRLLDERKRAEESLVLFRRLIDHSSDGIEVVDPQTGRFLDVNERTCEQLGYSREEMLSMSLPDIEVEALTKESLPAVMEELRRTGFMVVEGRERRKDGTTFPAEVNARYIRLNRDYVLAVVRDITERKNAEETLQRLRGQSASILNSVAEGVHGIGLDGNITFENPAALAMLGYENAELIGKPAHRTMHHTRSDGTPYPEGECPIYATLRDGLVRHVADEVFWREDGTSLPVEYTCTSLRDKDGTIIGATVVFTDITERKRAEEKLRQREADLADAQRIAKLGSWSYDIPNNKVRWSDELFRIFGIEKPLFEGTHESFLNYVVPEDQPKILQVNAEARAHGTSYDVEYRIKTQGGDLKTILEIGCGRRDAEGNIVYLIGTAQDITERKKLEAQFLRAQRMESIGTLAAGIAHDLNNVLAPILMAVEILGDKVTDNTGREILTTLEASARHGADLVRQVLGFARGIEGKRITINAVHLLNDIQQMIRDTFPKNINFRFAPSRDLRMVSGDPTQLHQVFTNLCVNARDAMPNGGNLNVTMENAEVDETYAGMNPDSKPGEYVVVKVEDTGTGIPSEMQDRIFEPFFTTKEIGKGTGLGLSTTLAIVRSHGGFITVSSEMGKGTTFKVFLPADTTSKASEKFTAKKSPLPRGNGELVLVVDDEKSIRAIAQKILEQFGYRVITAVNGAEAVAAYAQYSEEIAIVFTDMAMPVMDGSATIVALKTMNPRVKLIASSGLTGNGEFANAAGIGIKHFIQKPYTTEAMLTIIAKALQEQP